MRLGVLFRRELALAWGAGGGPLLAAAFYAGTATLLAFAVGPEPAILGAVAAGSAWVALALSTLLSLERLFARDYEDGALDLLALGPAPARAGRGGEVPGRNGWRPARRWRCWRRWSRSRSAPTRPWRR